MTNAASKTTKHSHVTYTRHLQLPYNTRDQRLINRYHLSETT